MKKAILLFTLLTSFTFPLYSLEINLRLDKNKAILGETVTLEIAISGGAIFNKPKIEIPNGLSVHSQSESQKIEVINWQMNRSVVYTLLLVPSRVGTFTLGPAVLDVGGRLLKSNTATLEAFEQKTTQIPGTPQTGVLQPFKPPQFKRSLQEMLAEKNKPQQSQAAQPAKQEQAKRKGEEPPLVFIDTKMDKKEGFVGEPLQFSVVFYTRIPFASQPQYTPPPMSGFWKEELPQRTYTTTTHGANFSATEIPMVLFPQTPGELQIGSAKVRVELESSGQDPLDPFDPKFFQQFFSMGTSETKVLQTKRVGFKAKALPEEGRPNDFSGAVGEYKIEANVDKKELKVGESLTLTIKISGEGNIKGLPSPFYPNLEGTFRSYETEKTETISKRGPTITGEKIFKLLLIPQVPGQPDLTIPSISYAYFDPDTKSYKRTETNPLSVKVSGEPLATAAAGSQGTPEAKKLTEDIEYLETSLPQASLWRGLTQKVAKSWPLTSSLPVILWAATLLVEFARKKTALKKKHPLEKIMASLTQASRLWQQQKTKEALETLAKALEGALVNILKLPASQLTARALLDTLSKKASSQETLIIKKLLEELQSLRFAPNQEITTKDFNELVAKIKQAKKILEKL